jgi:Ca-activated chloride channel family protein
VSDLRFAQPEWVHALWVVAVALAMLIWLERRGGRALGRFIAAPMQARIVRRPTTLRRSLRMGLLGLAAVSLVVALMRPQWGIEFVTSREVGAEIMIALDVSKSMLAEDVVPNRLERAKAEIRDLLPYLEGDQVGLIAFAGRASVLCPLTPDFSFLRLVLDNIDGATIRRGGTRLEEPIRKAVAGFGASGDLSRVILLITDGEDHDSFPLDAAKEAAERGVHIISIGFGDENGSEIQLTDPQSGARTLLRDADGRPVVSRLDGDMLRELAVLTEGAYVPAGTGVLDLESIFEAHLRPLMRASGEERGRTVHKDGFQWAILLALLALLGSVATHAGGAAPAASGLALLLIVGSPQPGLAQPAPGAPPIPMAADDALAPEAGPDVEVPGDAQGSAEASSQLDVPEDPRDAYNRGLEALEANALDDAGRLLEASRSSARHDGEVRFRATYNLGWVDVQRAEADIEGDPQAALDALERAADWFREAIALRPESEDPRRNLEIVLQRALALSDSLAERSPEDVAARLDGLIEAQRVAVAGLRGLVELAQASDDPNVKDALRPQFKRAAVEERGILSQASVLSNLAGQELDAIEALGDEERTPEDEMRGAQLRGLLHHLHRARERVGQARSLLRQRRAERAFRRAATGLDNLKRAREQLHDPVRVLDDLIRDTAGLLQETRTLTLSSLGVGLSQPSPQAPAPAWLSADYLRESQDAITGRGEELAARFEAVAGAASPEDPEQAALLEQALAAEPHISAAHGHFDEAGEALLAERIDEAAVAQTEALGALIEAREQFLDLKRLIEVAYADEQRIGALLEPGEDRDDSVLAEYGPALAGLQERNLERARRMAPLLERMVEQLDAPADPDDPGAEQSRASERERLELAEGILALTESSMSGAAKALAQLGQVPESAAQSRTLVESASKGLHNLRRLFFSIVEHIRDAAEQQIELGDRTEAMLARGPEQRPTRAEPIAHGQQALTTHTRELADALHQQALADPAALAGEAAAQDPAAAQEAADKLTRAAELVLLAGDEMDQAAVGLGDVSVSGESIRSFQDAAVRKLAEALAILQPPQENQQQNEEDQEQGDEQQEQQGQDQQEQGSDGEGQQPSAQPEEAEGQQGDPAQLLQSVRDREAERHRERGRQGSRGYEPVDKDW